MMRKSACILILLAVGIGAVVPWKYGRARAGQQNRKSTSPAGRPVPEDRQLPPVPALSLQVNGEDDLRLIHGTPFILAVRLANPRAMNAVLQNASQEAYVADLKERMGRGEIPKEKGDASVAAFSRKRDVKVVELGSERSKVETFLTFALLSSDGRRSPVTWPLKVIQTPQRLPIILDGESTAEIEYAVDPSSAQAIAVGEYQVIAVLEVPPSATLPASSWRGREQSEAAKIKISPGPPASAADEESTNMDFADYFYATGDLAGALERAAKVTATNPKSIPAWTTVGDVKERQGDAEGALAAYLTAKSEFYRQHPKSYEAPLYLIGKTNALLEKLRITK